MLKVAIFIGRTRLKHRVGCYRVGSCCTQARFSAAVGFDWLLDPRHVRPRAARKGRPGGLDAGRGGIDRLLCSGGFRDRPRDDFVRVSAALGFNRWCGHDGGAALDRGPLHLAHLTWRRRLRLERLEEPERAPQLGQRGAAIAQERVERPGAVAVADQGQTEIPLAPQVVTKQPGLDALGALEPPDGAGDARGEQALQVALGGQLRQQRCLERGEFFGVLVAHHHEFLGAKTVFEGVLRRSRLALDGLGPARLRAVATARRGARGG
jgi:hypothetical protein